VSKAMTGSNSTVTGSSWPEVRLEIKDWYIPKLSPEAWKMSYEQTLSKPATTPGKPTSPLQSFLVDRKVTGWAFVDEVAQLDLEGGQQLNFRHEHGVLYCQKCEYLPPLQPGSSRGDDAVFGRLRGLMLTRVRRGEHGTWQLFFEATASELYSLWITKGNKPDQVIVQLETEVSSKTFDRLTGLVGPRLGYVNEQPLATS
jgi:hypothetical protein